MQVQVYLFFAGRCEEAIDFYKKTLGAEVMMLMRFKDSPEPPQPGMIPPGSEDKVMHTCLRIGDTMVIWLPMADVKAHPLPGIFSLANGGG